jgi:hypothetical protein
MTEAISSPFAAWESFYVIAGSSGAALTGLQFVVIALIADHEVASSDREINAWGTPTVVHFSAVLLLAALLSAPWPSLSAAAVVLGVAGLAGIGYAGVVIRRARRITGYQPVFEDWLWHTILPLVAYLTITVAAFTLSRRTPEALFGFAGASLLLLFIGIHNSWDTVTFIATQRLGRKSENAPS